MNEMNVVNQDSQGVRFLDEGCNSEWDLYTLAGNLTTILMKCPKEQE